MKKIDVFVAAGLGLVQLALLSTAAHAQDTARVLNGVVVTATRSPKRLSDIGRVVTVITAEDISHARGKTLPELLNTVSGITFSGANNAPGISSSIFVRGMSTGNTLILVDGFPVYNAANIDNRYDLNAFPLDQIDHIEILKGSGSTLYGSDAVAGVINIITKHATGQGLKSNIRLAGGTYNTFKESAGLSGNINKTGIAVNLSNTDSRGFPAAADTTGKAGFRNDGFHQRSASVNLNQQLSERILLNGNLQTSYNTGNLPQSAFTDDKNYTYANTFLFGDLGAKLKLDKGQLKVNLSQNDVWNNYNDPASSANGGFGSFQKNSGYITNAELVFNYDLNAHFDITSGAGFKYFKTNQVSTFDTLRSKSSNIGSIYTSLFYKSGIFHMELGGRYNHDNKYGNNFSYTINPSLLLFDRLKLFGTMASAFKAPSLYQLFSQYGNVDLKPETTTSYEAGFDWELVKKILSFNTVFYNYNTKDVIYFAPLPGAPYGVYKNGESLNNKGFESEVKINVDKLKATAYAAYVAGTLTDVSGIKTNNLIRQPSHTYGATAYYQLFTKFSAGLIYKYTGDRIDEKFDPVTFAGSNVILKHYNLLNAHLQYDADKHTTLFVDLKNLLDEKYYDWLGYNTARFNFMAGIKYQFN